MTRLVLTILSIGALAIFAMAVATIDPASSASLMMLSGNREYSFGTAAQWRVQGPDILGVALRSFMNAPSRPFR
jgi:hypothetical protein